MRVSSAVPIVSSQRHLPWRNRSPHMRRPSPLPTVVPTRSSYLQRFLWLLGIGR
jgi:hypothetical protein